MPKFIFSLVAAFFMAQAAIAQDMAYIQIEAQPSLTRAEDRARDYASVLNDVNGFSLGGGWYGLALGPYPRAEAEALLRQLRGNGQVPRDSYIEEPGQYGRQFWPVGAALNAPRPQPVPQVETPELPQQAVQTPAAPAVVDETPRQARASEAQLTRAEREELQIALRWAGVYNAGIDGAFGRGTRGSMAQWQRDNGFEATGILTTRQRADLLKQYNAVLDGMGLRQVTESKAGITMQLPMGIVAFDHYEAPFVHYTPTTDFDARVILISQPGDRDTLYGLYEIMQTLEIVPLEGPRERQRNSFTLTGSNARITSHTEARVVNGTIKGFTLVWPAGDEERRTRVLAEMQKSFATTPAVLDPAQFKDDAQNIDLVAGLNVRRPKISRSGFYISRDGSVATTSEATQQCARITLDGEHEATVIASDPDLGIAVLRPASQLAPISVASFRQTPPRLQSEVAISGYSFGGVLSAPTVTYGTLQDLRGLSGDERLERLAVNAHPGDAGGPVYDTGGAVLGMLLPRDEGGKQLPDEVSFAADANTLREFFGTLGVTIDPAAAATPMAPEDLTRLASGMTVLVSCWE
ncbi:trypsin-like peptidase domain-containing protein [Primorskyibacter flagellatus]|uniref:Putative peptidoglycan binding domain-containing protein n=1 Tax=Primorskyibacter flagellatus TaxID=1387277 RepID=A0A1W2BIC1_9RHOB|nr:trypsin-like peptidase domain-containing protein [Primorskyibacter flagellatus]SMC72178.1 Putative peptidoglycan binding domain-containing protein [Primorskyibacter flagellatus]